MKKTRLWKPGMALLLSLLMLVGLSVTAFAGNSLPPTNSVIATEDSSVLQDGAVPADDSSIPRDNSVPADDSSIPQDNSVPAGDSSIPQDNSAPANDSSIPQDDSVPAGDSSVPQDDSVPADDSFIPAEDASLVEDGLEGMEEGGPEAAATVEEDAAEVEADPQLWAGGSVAVNANGMHLFVQKNDGPKEEKSAGATITIDTQGTTTVELTYAWTLAGSTNTINAGDWTYIVGGNIPDKLPIGSLAGMKLDINTGSTLLNPATGQPYKIGAITFERDPVSGDWRAKLTFDGEVRGLLNVTGGHSVKAVIDVTQVKVLGDTVSFDDLGGLKFTFTKPNASSLTKSCLGAYEGSAGTTEMNYRYDTIRWQLDVNTAMGSSVPATIVDTLTTSGYSTSSTPVNHYFVPAGMANGADIQVYPLEKRGDSWVLGTPLSRTDNAPDADGAKTYRVTVSGTGDKVCTIELGTISQAYRIVLNSHTDLAKNSGTSNWLGYYNLATMKVDENTTYRDTDSYGRNVRPWLSKSGTGRKISGVDYIEWTILFNTSLLNLGTAVTFTDLLDQYSDFTAEDIAAAVLYPVKTYVPGNSPTYDETSNLWGTNNTYVSYSFDTGNAKNLNITFKDLNGKGYKLVLRSKVDTTKLNEAKLNGVVNKVTTATPATEVSATAWPYDDLGYLSLSKKAGTADYKNQILRWTIEGNASSNSLAGTIITDRFTTVPNGCSLELLPGSLEVFLGTPAAKGAEVTNVTLTDLNGNQSDYTKGFILTINDQITGKYFVTYNTAYTVKMTAGALGGYTAGAFRNTAVATYITAVGTKDFSSYADQNVPDAAAANAAKSHEVTGTDADIKWTIDFNYNRADLSATDIYLTDSFSPGTTFKGALADIKITKFVWQADGTYLEQAAVRGVDYEWISTPVNSTTGFKLKLMKVKERFSIVYSTTVDLIGGQPAFANYINTADFNDKADGSGNGLTVKDQVDLTGGTTALAKDGNREGDYFRWTINVNNSTPPKVIAAGAVLTDILGRGQILNVNSIEVTHAETGSSLPETAYTLAVEERNPENFTTTFTVTFKTILDYPVKISYLSTLDPATAQLDPDDSSKLLVTNSARFSGESSTSWSYKNQTSVAVSGAGTGAGAAIPLRIEKYARDGSTTTALDGAEFTLRSASGAYKKEHITTLDGRSGQMELLAGTYIIEETVVPDGYQKAADQTITLNADTAREGGVVVIKFYNVPVPPTPDPEPEPDPTYTLIVLKRDADSGAALAGAQFEVLNSAGLSQGSITMGSDGAGALGTQLPAGTYTVVETVAPEGYELPPNPNFTVQVPGTGAQNNVVTVTITNQKPETPPTPDPEPDPDPTYTLSLLKQDADTGAALAGAQFVVTDSDGTYKGIITTGSNGKGSLAKKLPAGTYTVTETLAPSGYALPENAKTTVKLPGAHEKNGVVSITITNQKATVTPQGEPDPIDPVVPPAGPVRPVVPPDVDPPVDNTTQGVIVPNTPERTQPPNGGGGNEAPDLEYDAAPAPVTLGDEGPDGISVSDFLNIPLGGLGVSLAWSLLNLIMSILSLLAAIVLIVSMVKRKKTNPASNNAQQDEDEMEEDGDEKPVRTRRLGLRLLAILTGFIPGVLFLILENIRLPMTWITRWTPIIGLFFIINMVALLLHFILTKRAAKNKPEDHDANTAAPHYA